MGESISKSEISVNSNQRSVLVPKTKAVLVSENIQPKLLNHNSNCKGKKRITIQEYRKQIGHTVINQLSTEKLGITAKPESNLEEKCRGQSPNPDRATCPLCGHVICSTNKCLRCMRVFEKEKTFHHTSNLKSLPGNKSSRISQMSKVSSDGTRRPRTQNALTSRQSRARFEEPQCVTLSSNEDDNSFQETKKLKCDGTHKSSEKLDENPSIVIQVQPNIIESEASNGVSMHLPVDTEENLGSNDMHLWKEGGLNGPFFAVNCRSVCIGSYKIVPVGRVLFSPEGIMLRAPVFYNHDKPSEKSAVFNNVAIPAQQILKVDAYFSRKLDVIFLNVFPNWCRQLSSKLGLSKSGPYWDSASKDENKKRLTLLPNDLDDAAMNAIKQVFVSQGVYHEINRSEANRLLVISSPPPTLKRLTASTAVSAEASVSTTETQDVNGGKEDSCKVELRSVANTGHGEMYVIKHMTNLFVQQSNCDVQFCFKGSRIKVGGHASILAARSPVFAAMFQHDMQEKKTGKVVIKDIKPDIFKDLLHYIYSGRTSAPLNQKTAQLMFMAADKYNIDDLKEYCATFLLSEMETTDALGLLIWAHLNSIEKIKEASIKFIAAHARIIFRTSEWKEACTAHPNLCLLITQRM